MSLAMHRVTMHLHEKSKTAAFWPLTAFVLLTAGCGSSDAEATVAEDAQAADSATPGVDSASPSDVAAPVDVAVDTNVVVDAAPPTVTTLFGASFNPHTDARFADLIAQWGGMQVVRSFDGGSGVNPFLSTYQAQDLKKGAASAYSFKYPPAEVIAGKHDADVTRFFEGIADDHLTYWTYWHEPDDELYKTKTFTPTQYRGAWAHLRKLADAAKARRPKLVAFATLIIMEYSMRPTIAPSRPLLGTDGMYPGDDVIEVFGVDTYNTSAPSGSEGDPPTQYGKVIDFAKAHGKPWAIGELGSCVVAGKPNGRANYLSNSIKYWKSRGSMPLYVAYFNIDWPTCDYRLDTDAAATKVWHDAVTLGYKAF